MAELTIHNIVRITMSKTQSKGNDGALVGQRWTCLKINLVDDKNNYHEVTIYPKVGCKLVVHPSVLGLDGLDVGTPAPEDVGD